MPTNADRLLLLADHIKLSLLERNRAISLKLEPNTADAYITRSLETLRQGIEQIEHEQTRMEEHGEVSSKVLRQQEDILIKLRSAYDDLVSKFQTPSENTVPPTAAPIDLSNMSSKKALSPQNEPYSDNDDNDHYPSSRGLASYDEEEQAAREALMGSSSRSPMSAAMRKSKTVRFSDNLVDTDDLSNHQVMQLHQTIMDEQDESLDRLSESVRRQRELSIQIGDELDNQVELLDDIDDGVDRTQRRLNGAKKRLDFVARKAKDNGSLITIAVLIIILVLLIALLK